jgi:dTDP-4-dehydrorhamnose 3,5-epimerase
MRERPVIDGVQVRPLRIISDSRGDIMHMMKASDDAFQQFGEIYFSLIIPGAVKAWHLHEKMTINYAVPQGSIKLALFDDRADSPTRGQINEIVLGSSNYQLVTIPPKIWNGFIGTGDQVSIVANCATIPHDPNEIHRLDPHTTEVPYVWDARS